MLKILDLRHMIHIRVICGQDDDVVAERVTLGVYSIGKRLGCGCYDTKHLLKPV